MAIQAISSVKNNGCVNFAGKKKNKDAQISQSAHSSSVTNTLKAVPLAVLIAMSPMVNAQNNKKFYGSNDKEIVRYDCSSIDFKRNTTIMLVSTDGDDSPERIDLYRTGRSSTRMTVNGESIPCYYDVTKRVHVDTLVIKDVTRVPIDGRGEIKKSTVYSVRGLGEDFHGEIKSTKTNKVVSDKTYKSKLEVMDIDVSKELFDELNNMYGGSIPIVREREDGLYEHLY